MISLPLLTLLNPNCSGRQAQLQDLGGTTALLALAGPRSAHAMAALGASAVASLPAGSHAMFGFQAREPPPPLRSCPPVGVRCAALCSASLRRRSCQRSWARAKVTVSRVLQGRCGAVQL